MRILLVEDDPMVGRALKAGVTQDGHAADWVQTAAAADVAWLAPSLEVESYDVVIVDLGLPDGNGLDLIRKARAREKTSAVVVVTARDRVADRIQGLDAGADDYMVKPIDLDELAARLRAIDRRRSGRLQQKCAFGALVSDMEARAVSLRDRRVEVTAGEFALLSALSWRPGAIVPRAKLEEALYDWDHAVESNSIEVQIHRLRRKLGPSCIETHRGLGYRLVEPLEG